MTKKENDNLLIAGLLVGGGLLLLSKKNQDDNNPPTGGSGFGGTTNTGQPRSLANNNPTNIALSNISWQGKVPNSQNTDQYLGINPPLEQFNSPVYGWRAALINYNSYINNNYDTLKKVIDRWAGSHNQNYIDFVVDGAREYNSQISENDLLYDFADFRSVSNNQPYPYGFIWPIMRNMAIFEAGQNYAGQVLALEPDFQQAYNMLIQEGKL